MKTSWRIVATESIPHPDASYQHPVCVGDIIGPDAIKFLALEYGIDHVAGIWCATLDVARTVQKQRGYSE